MAYPHIRSFESTANPYAKMVNNFGQMYHDEYYAPSYSRDPSRLPEFIPAPVHIPDSEAYNVARLLGSRPDEWQRFIHPNGSSYWLYYWSTGTWVVSDVEPPLFLKSPLIISEIQAASRDLISSPSFFDCLDIYITENGCSYVEHVHRTAIPAQQNLVQLQARITNLQSLPLTQRLKLEGQYWTFTESHPNHRALLPVVLDEVSAALTWCYADRVLYEASSSPFEKETSREMLDLIQNIKNMAEGDRPGSPAIIIRTWYCAAVMRTVVYARQHSLYGRRGATEIRRRAQSDDLDIKMPFNSATEWLMWHIAGLLTFGSPFGYFKRINNVDRTIIKDGINTIRWKSFLKELCKEWTDYNLLATVLVAGTVALLAIPGINGISQLAGFLSALCALGSVLAGTLLVANHQSRIESSSNAALIYFMRAKSHGLGTTRPLAVILSLPVALMLWGMFWFVFAIGSNAYASGLPGISEKYLLSTRVIVLSLILAFLILGILVVLFFYRVWVPSTAGQGKKKPVLSPVLPNFIHVDTPDIGQNILPTSTADILPDHTAYMQSTIHITPSSVPQAESQYIMLPRSQRPSHYRRPTLEYDNLPTRVRFVPSSMASSQSLDTDMYPPHVVTPPTPSTRSQSLNSWTYPPTARRGDSVSSTQYTQYTRNNPLETPILSSIPYPATPSRGYFVDIDATRVAPYATATVPEFHVFQHGSQITLIASTGQIALLLTTQNEAIWNFLLEDDVRYIALVTDIRTTCEQYGDIDSISVPRRETYQVRPEAIGQACVRFTRPEAASHALRGFMGRPLEHCPVSARLLTEEEEMAWGISRQTLHPTLSTVTEEETVYEDAASVRAESPESLETSTSVGDVVNRPGTNNVEGSTSRQLAYLPPTPSSTSAPGRGKGKAPNRRF